MSKDTYTAHSCKFKVVLRNFKALLIISLLIESFAHTYAQEINLEKEIKQTNNMTYDKFRISFTDKANSPYSLTSPSTFLSQRAIDRRNRQNISYNWYDLPINPWYIDSLKNIGVTVINYSKWFNSAIIYCNDVNQLQHISSLPFVNRIDSVARTSAKKTSKKNHNTLPSPNIDLNSNNTSSITNAKYNDLQNKINKLTVNSYNYGYGTNQIQMIGGDLLHNLGYNGQGMLIAILDAGFFHVNTIPAFDSLWINNQIAGFKDFVDPTADLFQESTHGMMVLSTMGANVSGQLVGTAPKANYWLLRSEDASYEYIIEEDNWAAAAEFADSVGADIINSSLGYTEFDEPSQNHTYENLDGNTALVTRAADIAASKGILVVNSAGNSGAEAWTYIGTPADADSILTVGAVDATSQLAYFSSIGPTSDYRIKPNVCAQGMGTAVINYNGNITSANGTSFSSPITAGMVACLWQANPDAKNMDIISAIEQSSNLYASPNYTFGYGIPNFFAANSIISGISIPNLETGVSIFPNPFSDYLFVSFFAEDTQKVSIDILDLTGKYIFKSNEFATNFGFNQFLINDLKSLPKGLYFLKITVSNKIIIQKILR